MIKFSHIQGRAGDAQPEVELAGGMGRIAAVAHQSPGRDVVAVAHQHQQPPALVLHSGDSLACLGSQHPDDDDDGQLGYSARRSFARLRRATARDDDALAACSPAPLPGYMASTASTKAKFRSMRTPKERSGASDVCYSEHCSPFADRLLPPIPSMSPIPSIASDIGFARSSRPPVAQRSPRVKGPMTPTRSRSPRSPSHQSFGSEAALHQLQMEQHTPIR